MKIIRGVLMVMVALLAAACGGLSNASGGSAGSGNHSVTVVNDTGEQICYLFMSSSDQQDWGEDWLGQSEMLSSGGSFTIRVSEPGEYDILALPCGQFNEDTDLDAVALDIEYGLSVEGSVTWTAGG